MVKIKPFAAIRPPKQYASEVASRPYDVLNSVEAQAEATERSLLHIIKPEIDFTPIADEHSEKVYQKAVENFAERSCRMIDYLTYELGYPSELVELIVTGRVLTKEQADRWLKNN